MFGLHAHGLASDAQSREGAHHELAGGHSPQDAGHRPAQRAPCRPKRVGKVIEKVNSKQADLKQRAAASTDWGSVVEKLSSALKQQAGAARAEALARAVEKIRSRQTWLPVRMADSDFDRLWYGHRPDEAHKAVASGPELDKTVALLESSPQRSSVLSE
jgi:hypothetical protein